MPRPRPEELITIVRVNRPSDEALLAALRIVLERGRKTTTKPEEKAS